MIKNFSDEAAERIWNEGPSKDPLQRQIFKRLSFLDAASNLSQLAALPSNRLHKLSGDREGQHSISVNMQYRICFVWDEDGAREVEVVDYH